MPEQSVNALAYSRAQISNVLGRPVPAGFLDAALEQDVFRELSRTPEVESGRRDMWGNWDFSFGESNLNGQLYEPWLDRPLADLRKRLDAAGGSPGEPTWPDGKPFAVCLTHDVDYITLQPSMQGCIRTLARNIGLLGRGPRDGSPRSAVLRGMAVAGFRIASLKVLQPRAERAYDEWLDLEGGHGFKSTFHFFPERLTHPHVFDCEYRYADPATFRGRRLRVDGMMKEIAAAGWDVGLHGSYHSALEPGLLGDQRKQVEDAVGREVVSTRQHWLHYDARVTPALQAAAGLKVDSTQGFNRNVGFRAGTSFPYYAWDFDGDRALPVLEIPQHVMDGGLFTPNALEYDATLAVRHCLKLMDAVQSVGGCLTLSWHPNSIQDAICFGVYQDVLAEAARRGAWGCSMSELRDWWTLRAARVEAGAPAGAQ